MVDITTARGTNRTWQTSKQTERYIQSMADITTERYKQSMANIKTDTERHKQGMTDIKTGREAQTEHDRHQNRQRGTNWAWQTSGEAKRHKQSMADIETDRE